MWRRVHSYIGLGALLVLIAVALSGAVLATRPLLEAASAPAVNAGESVAALVERTLLANPDIEIDRIKRLPSGRYEMRYGNGGRLVSGALNPLTGEIAPSASKSPLYKFMTDLHRSLFLGKLGRAIVGFAALAMGVLSVSGLLLVIRKTGGIKALFAPIRGKFSERWHTVLGRLAFVPLIILAVTGCYLVLITFDVLPSGSETPPRMPESAEELAYVPPHELAALNDIVLADMREITFPIPGDWFDVFALKTNAGHIFIDQFTGALISTEPYTLAQKTMEWMYLLHTGEGAGLWALVLLLGALMVPFFSITGLVVWWRRIRGGMGKVAGNSPAQTADTVILVGSEGNTTWGFAKELHSALRDSGSKVHIAGLGGLRPAYPAAREIIALASTYGDGGPPQNAARFEKRMAGFTPASGQGFSVLAFGDTAFSHYCAFGQKVDAAFAGKNMARNIPYFEIDKQSSQSFAAWGQQRGLALDYTPPRPKTHKLVLEARADFGADIGAPISVLRFRPVRKMRHVAGDLIAILPPNSTIPRYYSLASASAEGFVEICVSNRAGGLCSGYLCGLQQGDEIDGFIAYNPDFKMPRRDAVIMIGAGTGIAPFAGMIRQNQRGNPIDLFWGNRHPNSDFLYENEIKSWLDDGRLTAFHPAFSRIDPKSYVQDVLRRSEQHLRDRLRHGATVMVCGSQQMASAVRAEIDLLAGDVGTSLAALKRARRYREDVY
ncbi:MAG: PepSY domain-containing protein [Rhodobacteraceae bacterium]|nr:PepSY domain-containing protein [Paracoccaceae bacterium]